MVVVVVVVAVLVVGGVVVVVEVVVVVVKRHERLKHEGDAPMAEDCISAMHVKAASLDILLDSIDLASLTTARRQYCVCLLQAYWYQASAQTIITDFQAIAQAEDIRELQAFCQRNYPQFLRHFDATSPSQ